MNILRGRYADHYVTLKQAHALVEAMKIAVDWREVEHISSVSNPEEATYRAYMIHGLPELDPTAVAVWASGVLDRRLNEKRHRSISAVASDRQCPSQGRVCRDTYGFTRQA